MNLLKKIIFAAFIIYSYNLIAINFNMILPFNFITILFVTFFGAPGLFSLILFKIIIL